MYETCVLNSLWESRTPSHWVIYDGNFAFQASRTFLALCSFARGMPNAKAKKTLEISVEVFTAPGFQVVTSVGWRLCFSHEQSPTKEFPPTLYYFLTIFHATIFRLPSRKNYHVKTRHANELSRYKICLTTFVSSANHRKIDGSMLYWHVPGSPNKYTRSG